MTFYRAFVLISYGSVALTATLVVVLRCCWRRSKALQEP